MTSSINKDLAQGLERLNSTLLSLGFGRIFFPRDCLLLENGNRRGYFHKSSSHSDLCYCYWVCTSKCCSWWPDPGNKRTFSYRYSLIPSQWQEWVDSRSSFIPHSWDISEACPLGVFSPVLSIRRSHFPGRLSQKERKRILKGYAPWSWSRARIGISWTRSL